MPAATAAADPALDPPGDSLGFQGLRVASKTGLSLVPLYPNSVAFVFPMITAPAPRRRSTTTSSSSGTKSA